MVSLVIPYPSEKVSLYVIRNKVTKKVLCNLFKRKGIKVSDDQLNDPEFVLTKLDPDDLRFLVDNYLGISIKSSIYLFKLSKPVFTSFDELVNKIKDLGILNKVNKFLRVGKLSPTIPKPRVIYLNTHYKEMLILMGALSRRTELYEEEETGKVIRMRKIIGITVVFRENFPVVDVRVSYGGVEIAKTALDVALKKVLRQGDIKYQFMSFSTLDFIKNVLEYIDTVGYLTLEFSSTDRSYGKISYSGRRLRAGRSNLLSDAEIRNKVIEAFKKGFITRAHGELEINEGTLSDNKISFGINFRESKVYLFSNVCEGSLNVLIKTLYEIHTKSYGGAIERRRKTILDFIGS